MAFLTIGKATEQCFSHLFTTQGAENATHVPAAGYRSLYPVGTVPKMEGRTTLKSKQWNSACDQCMA